MLKTTNWLYLDVHKTGSTFLIKKLTQIFSNSHFEINKRHSPPVINYKVPKIITIRQAKSYYLSLWSYGLEEKGSFYQVIRNFYPEKLDLFYKSASKDSFSYFLDFALNNPSTDPIRKISKTNISNLIFKSKPRRNFLNEFFKKNDKTWLPDSCDIYTARILEMLIAKSERVNFINNLKADLSYENLNTNLKIYIPEIIIRTNSLNKDFYTYYQNNKLNFLNLPKGWEQIFSLKDIPINKSTNSSSKLKSRNLEKYLSEYHTDLIRTKSNLANLLLDKAEEKLN